MLTSISADLSQLVSALQHAKQREILTALATANKSVELPVSKFVGIDTQDVLYYHLPTLVDAGYVQFDGDARVVTRGPRFAAIQPFLEIANGHHHAEDTQ